MFNVREMQHRPPKRPYIEGAGLTVEDQALLDSLTPGAEPNAIEKILLNGEFVPIENKTVQLDVTLEYQVDHIIQNERDARIQGDLANEQALQEYKQAVDTELYGESPAAPDQPSRLDNLEESLGVFEAKIGVLPEDKTFAELIDETFAKKTEVETSFEQHNEALADLAGAGRTTETVKQNAEDIALLRGDASSDTEATLSIQGLTKRIDRHEADATEQFTLLQQADAAAAQNFTEFEQQYSKDLEKLNNADKVQQEAFSEFAAQYSQDLTDLNNVDKAQQEAFSTFTTQYSQDLIKLNNADKTQQEVFSTFTTEYNQHLTDLTDADKAQQEAFTTFTTQYNQDLIELNNADTLNSQAVEALTNEYNSKIAELEAVDDQTATAINDITKVGGLLDQNNIYQTDILTVNALGGIPANANLNGLTIHEILTKLIYPYVAPVISNIKALPKNGGIYEYGTTYTITGVSGTVIKKSNNINSITLYNGATLISTLEPVSSSGGNFSFTDLNIIVPTAGNQLTVKVDDGETIQSGTTAKATFVYPYYMGICAASDVLTGNFIKNLTKKIESKSNKSHTYTANNEQLIFAYPASYGPLTSILDPSGFENIAGFERSELAIQGLDNKEINYYVYRSKAPATVTNFTMQFKY